MADDELALAREIQALLREIQVDLCGLKASLSSLEESADLTNERVSGVELAVTLLDEELREWIADVTS